MRYMYLMSLLIHRARYTSDKCVSPNIVVVVRRRSQLYKRSVMLPLHTARFLLLIVAIEPHIRSSHSRRSRVLNGRALN